MIKIAVLSDTHIPIAADDIPKAVYEGIAGVDMILHAGDLLKLDIFDRLSKIAPVKAVCGNMDDVNVRSRLPNKDVITIGQVSIGLIHGWGAPSDLIDLVSHEFKDVDAIVFGHSHSPLIETKNGILFFNPGSPTDKVFAPYNSYGILEIEDKKIIPYIIKI